MPELWLATFDPALQPPPWHFQTPDGSTIIEATVGLSGFQLGFDAPIGSGSAKSVHLLELRALLRNVVGASLEADFVSRLSSGGSDVGVGSARVSVLAASTTGDAIVSATAATWVTGQPPPSVTLDPGVNAAQAFVAGFGAVYAQASHNVASLEVAAGNSTAGALAASVTLSDRSEHTGEGSVDVGVLGASATAAAIVSDRIPLTAAAVSAGTPQVWTGPAWVTAFSQAVVLIKRFALTAQAGSDAKLAWVSLQASTPVLIGNQVLFQVQGSTGPASTFDLSADVVIIAVPAAPPMGGA